jgi:UDP-glucose 4-epimerase
MSRALITGAGGYIGQHLCLNLLAKGWNVLGLGRSSKSAHLKETEWICGDITDADVVNRAIAASDAVIHLACLPLEESQRDPMQALRINIDGTLNLLEALRNERIGRFIFASTCQVYGGQGPLPNSELDLPHPRSAYAASKLSAEMWCEAYRNMYQLPVQTLRLFNVYGPSVDDSPRPTVETIFLRQVKSGGHPNVRGNPRNGRDFIHIHDVVKAFLHALDNPFCDGPVNIGTGVLTTIKELAHLATSVLDKSIKPNIIESNDPAICFQADITRASKFGFHAQIDLENGMRQLAQNYLIG